MSEDSDGSIVDLLRNAMELNVKLASAIERMRAPAEFGRSVMDDGSCYDLGETAKMLSPKLEAETGVGLGRNRLAEALRNMGVFMQDNEPYQPYLYHFRIVLKPTPVGMKKVPLCTGEGLSWVLPKLVEYYR